VRYRGQWHLFCTVRGRKRSHAIVQANFENWADAAEAEQTVLSCHSGYFCAPEVFYFADQARWYMICQASKEQWEPKYQAAYSTTTDISDPSSWAPLEPLGAKKANGKSGLDFWVICDEQKAYLFFTTLDGRMWREETSLEEFPGGWSQASLALKGDIFEASHIYKLRGIDSYLALIEAQGARNRRYFKAYLAEELNGEWKPLAAQRDKAFAAVNNVRQIGFHWTDSFSHGELFRAGYNQLLQVDPENLKFLYQGISERNRQGKSYGRIPWRLGILESR